MKLVFAAVAMLSLLMSSAAAELKVLTGEEIEELLPQIVAVGDQTRQTFSAAGGTTYTDRGRDSFGTWRVQDAQYCSLWPPSADWSCFQVIYDAEAAILIWVGETGHRLQNRVELKD